jgi:hypothetical protein
MSKTLFIGSFFLFFIWTIGFFVFHKGGIIHILPAIAIVTLLFRLFYDKAETHEEV